MAAPVPSPCIDQCKLDSAGRHCLGCLRTIDEIMAWSTADDEWKRAVLARLAALPLRRN